VDRDPLTDDLRRGTVAGIQNVFAENSQNAVRIRVARDTAATAPVVVPFTASR
jgi:hypothetical protein